MKTLTEGEEQVMLTLWRIGPALLMEIVEAMPEKKHKNTTATVLGRLVEKGFIRAEAFSRINKYHAVLTKDEYLTDVLKYLVDTYCNKSVAALAMKVKALKKN